MGLVDYSDDSGSEEAAGHGPTMELASDTAEPIAPATSVQQQLPMLPAGFIDSYSGAVRSSNRDDPELHQGRHRITPHVAGGWPTHVYLEWTPTEKEAGFIEEVIDAYRRRSTGGEAIYSLLKNDLGVPTPLHISLSAPISLATDQRDDFLGQLSSAIRNSNVSPFVMERGSLRWVSNLLKVRWFLVLGVVQLLEDQLDKLLEATNRVVRAFGQPGLYVNDGNSKHRFHISIGWTNMDQSKKAEKTEDEERLQELVFRPKEVALPRCDCVKVKIGNVIHSIGLVSRRQAASTLLG